MEKLLRYVFVAILVAIVSSINLLHSEINESNISNIWEYYKIDKAIKHISKLNESILDLKSLKSKFVKDKLLIFVDSNTVNMLDNNIKIKNISNIELDENIILSENGEYIGIFKHNKNSDKYIFILKDMYGKKYWDRVIENKNITILNNGMCVQLIDEYYPEYEDPGVDYNIECILYNEEGNVLVKMQLPRIISMKYLERKNSLLIMHVNKMGIYNIFNGEKICEMDKCNEYVASRDGQHIICVKELNGEHSIITYYKNCKIIMTLDVKSGLIGQIIPNKSLAITENGKYVVAIDNKNIYCFETESLKLKWKNTIEDECLFYRNVDISENAQYAIARVDYIGEIVKSDSGIDNYKKRGKSYIYLFDINGKKVWEDEELTEKEYDCPINKIEISRNGDMILIETKNMYKLLGIRK